MPWIGPVIGGVVGALGSGSGGGSTQTNSVPPEFSNLASMWAQRAQQMGDLPFQPYPYSQVADFNPLQYQGFDMGVQNAMNSQIPGAASSNLQQIIGGQANPYMGQANPYAGSNPYLENTINSTLGDVTKQFNQNIVPTEIARGLQSGSFGNSGLQERQDQNRYDLSKSLGNIASEMRMQDYTQQQGLAENALNRNASLFQQGQQNRLQGLGMAPSIDALGYQPAQYLQGVGGTLQQQGQNELNSWYDQFKQSQQWPFQTYSAMGAPFGANIGSVQTSSQQGSPVAGLFGGAMLGNQIGKAFTTPQANQTNGNAGMLFNGQQLNNPSAYTG